MATRRTCSCVILKRSRPDDLGRWWQFLILHQCGVHGWMVRK